MTFQLQQVSKEILIQYVKDWIKLDNDISKLKKEISQQNKLKKEITEKLIEIMKTSSTDTFTFKGGELICKQIKSKKPITKKSLLSILQNYYKDKEQPEMAEELTKHILDNQEITTKETIRKKISKKIFNT